MSRKASYLRISHIPAIHRCYYKSLFTILEMENIVNGSVRFLPKGRGGNQLFIYFASRIYAEIHQFNLIGEMEMPLIKVKPNKVYGKIPEKFIRYTIKDEDYLPEFQEYNYYGPGEYTFSGYHQVDDYFVKYKDLVLSFIDEVIEPIPARVSLHLRMGDYYYPGGRHLIINPDYYVHALKQIEGVKESPIHIVVNTPSHGWEKIYLAKLIGKLKESGIVDVRTISGSPKSDFTFIAQSEHIVASNSTFCYWAAFLSEAAVITFPFTGYDVKPSGDIIKWGPFHRFSNTGDKFVVCDDFSDNSRDYFYSF